MKEIARDVAVVAMPVANAYLVGTAQNWVLVDSGTPGHAKAIKEAAEQCFGANAKPRAIVLTHGHFDHAGSSPELAKEWNVSVYAHRLEFPYLTGASSYPPLDTSAPGAFSFLARFFPSNTVNIGTRIAELKDDFSEFGITGWKIVFTPGHTFGHVSFFRADDGILLAGDALTTMNLRNLTDIITRREELCAPPPPATYDWQKAHASVQKLASLKPYLIAAGHGKPMPAAAAPLQKLADDFPIPEHGRYVREPVRADEHGITYLPPKPPDRLVRAAVGVSAAAVAIGVGSYLVYKRNTD